MTIAGTTCPGPAAAGCSSIDGGAQHEHSAAREEPSKSVSLKCIGVCISFTVCRLYTESLGVAVHVGVAGPGLTGAVHASSIHVWLRCSRSKIPALRDAYAVDEVALEGRRNDGGNDALRYGWPSCPYSCPRSWRVGVKSMRSFR